MLRLHHITVADVNELRMHGSTCSLATCTCVGHTVMVSPLHMQYCAFTLMSRDCA